MKDSSSSRAVGSKSTLERLILPAALVAAVAVGGGLTLAAEAGGAASPTSPSSASTTPTTGTPVPTTGTTVPGALADRIAAATTTTTTPKGTTAAGGVSHENTTARSRGAYQPHAQRTRQTVVFHGHRVVAYGNSAILYVAPPTSYIPAGEALFQRDCSSCHGNQAEGTAYAPNLQGLGPATVNFWVSTGRMPADNPRAVQAPEKPPVLDSKQALQIAAYVNSLDPATPYIPLVNVKDANLAEGASLFALNCASCHTITGAGDALAKDTFSPSLHTHDQPTPTQTAEAMRTGPANMPRFNGGNLTDAQVRDITAYVVQKIQHPSNPGGFGLGGVGPVGEGFVALLFGVGGLMLVCYWIGDRTDRDDEDEEAVHGVESPGGGA